ncbi:MAG: Kef family K(+) transporter [Micavibrio aeruginosavorus]|uniref:Kef family K(+) transporter n=1 Tax=Micavibrio aeruginosavorus TaxID=349221 RepID=A0A2W4ZZA7_9BACT|nr:MAG: Kef family K(+) transporter [Micavibrio aeruginosavorus]
MHHDLPLLSTIAVGLSMAFALGLIATRLKLPPIVGYLLAGILVGSHTPGFTADQDIANELSEIGIVLLMFGVGLHFSLKDLMEVRRIAIPGAIAQMTAATAMGAGVGYMLGWGLGGSILFGLALSVASTVVLLRALEDHHLMESTSGQIAIGWLIVEDIAMIFALILVPALAGGTDGPDVNGNSPAMVLGIAMIKLAAFVAVMLIGGKRILPWVLRVVSRTGSRELFTLAVFAVAVGVAYGAAKLFGVSFALGAFFAGMMIRESDMNHEVADRALPFQDAFAVLFFVAVGMLFDPATIVNQPLNVLLVSFIIIFGKSIVAFALVMLLRYPLKTGLVVSAGLAQIGEFSFILAALGVAYGILPEEGRDLLLAGAMVSIAVNPLLMWGVKAIHTWAEKHPKLSKALDLRETNLSHMEIEEEEQLHKDLIIVVGYGRIGREICDNILDAGIDLVIIDSNRERVEMLRELGYHAITGDATHEETLHDAAIHKAAAIVIAVHDSFEGRRILEKARELKPNLRIIVRAQNEEEMLYFREKLVDFVSTPPREMGRAIIHYIEGMRSGVVPLRKTDF